MWGELLDKYDLRGNNWLNSLYEKRSYWVPVYLKDVFWAGMSTTQRSESMNAFFDGYVHSGTTLKEFVDQFDNALRKKVEVETTADFNSSNQMIPCVFPFNFEKQFQKVYTNTKFKEFQKELMGLMCCNCTLVTKQGCISTFDILDEISIHDCNKIVHYTLYYNEEECELKCTCALFEMRGILCRHALKVLHLSRINVVPDRYVLDRWRKDQKRTYTLIKSSYDDVRASGDSRRYEMVVKRCMKLATKIFPSDERVNAFLKVVDDFDSKCDDVTFGTTSESTKVGPNVDTADKGKKILSPNVVRGKGRPPSKRKVPPVEKITRKRKACRKILHDQTQLGDTAASEFVDQSNDGVGVGVGTQTSSVTQLNISGNQEMGKVNYMVLHFTGSLGCYLVPSVLVEIYYMRIHLNLSSLKIDICCNCLWVVLICPQEKDAKEFFLVPCFGVVTMSAQLVADIFIGMTFAWEEEKQLSKLEDFNVLVSEVVFYVIDNLAVLEIFSFSSHFYCSAAERLDKNRFYMYITNSDESVG
ncbi:protein FAR-RED ELONGATED HYPOCOTYL 3-like [Carya illinoinensis]|uniref:protein FAR-RED ELONGATED HYPOCOTYL 3-like n=1 Tax=Carya illinoinensis TaxID=32201 RepID=UPI001C71E42E|nr:protein FAR-RED ELONGATED HYPOCOTYL 3-like [Carya illinoinensis]